MSKEITTKEAVEILIEHLKETGNIHDLYRALANSLLDYCRMAAFYDNLLWTGEESEKKEYLHFMKRMTLNFIEVQNVLKGNPRPEFDLIEMPFKGSD